MSISDFPLFLTLAVSFVLFCWSITEWRLQDSRRHISHPVVGLFAFLQGLAILGRLTTTESFLLELCSVASGASWLGLLPPFQSASLKVKVVGLITFCLVLFGAIHYFDFDGLVMVAPLASLPFMLRVLKNPPSQSQISGIFFSLLLPVYVSLSLLVRIETGDAFSLWASNFPVTIGEAPWLALAAVVIIGSLAITASMRLFPLRSRRTYKFTLSSTFLFLFFIIALLSVEISQSLQKNTLQSLGASLDQNLNRLKQAISFVAEESNNAVRQIEPIAGIAIIEEKKSGTLVFPSEASEKIISILASLSGNAAAFIVDSEGTIVWGSAANILVPDTASIKSLAAKYRIRLSREGSPLSEFRSSISGAGAGYVVASLLTKDDQEIGMLLLVRPLNQLSDKNARAQNTDLLIGPHSVVLNLQGNPQNNMQMSYEFRPKDLLLPSQQSLVTNSKNELFLLSKDSLRTPRWQVASASKLSRSFLGGKTGLLVSLLFSALTFILYAFTLTAPRMLEVESSVRLHTKNPIKRPQDLAKVLGNYLRSVLDTEQNEAVDFKHPPSLVSATIADLAEQLLSFSSSRSEISASTSKFLLEDLRLTVASFLEQDLEKRSISLETIVGLPDTFELHTNFDAVKNVLLSILMRAISITPVGSGILLQTTLQNTALHNGNIVSFMISHPIDPAITTSVKDLYDPLWVVQQAGADAVRYLFAIELVAALRGEIDVQSASNIGARIEIKVPVSA